jgi:hypothetical protein
VEHAIDLAQRLFDLGYGLMQSISDRNISGDRKYDGAKRLEASNAPDGR